MRRRQRQRRRVPVSLRLSIPQTVQRPIPAVPRLPRWRPLARPPAVGSPRSGDGGQLMVTRAARAARPAGELGFRVLRKSLIVNCRARS